LTLLHRQIHPNLVRDGRSSWQAFKPSERDELQLSVSCDTKASAQVAFERHVARRNPKGQNLKSFGVLSVLRVECQQVERAVVADPVADDDSHHVIDFRGLADLEVELVAQRLHAFAEARGWSHRAA
jgi:hypothetical protein